MIYKEKIVFENIKDFEPVHIFECGQVFRWVPRDNAYIGFAGGYLIGSLISKGDIKRDLPVYGVCAAIAILGIPLHFIGVNKIKKAINDYNTKHGFAQTSPEVSFGVQNYGIGLAINF